MLMGEVLLYIQWGEQVFDTLPILQVFLLTKHVEVCNFYHRYTSTVRDGIISNWDKQFHKCVKCSIWLLLIALHGPTNILYINNIGIATKRIVWPLIHYIRHSLSNFSFPRYGYYILITTFVGFGYLFSKKNLQH